MAPVIGAAMIDQLQAQTLQDPLLPRDNPTTSFWQLPPHPTLSEVRSDSLASTTDYAIIGSGVTGCSIAKNLLELTSSETSSITVFEARTLTSGATGRNGGLLTSFAPSDFKLLSDMFGLEQAVKIARFANRTLEKMHELGNSSEELKNVSDIRKLSKVVIFRDDGTYHSAAESYKLYEKHVPEEGGKTQFLTKEEAESKYNVVAESGAIVFPSGAFWPYRLITHIWAQLLDQHRSRLSVETKTPVTIITHDKISNPNYPYVIHTPRGQVRAKRVIHATNGHSGHLLPELRGKIYPLRGTMSTQKSTRQFGNRGAEVSWSIVGGGGYDNDTQVVELGLYYSNQNPRTSDIFIGGEKVKVTELLVSDDTEVSAEGKENISSVLPRFHTKGWSNGEKPQVVQIWSGIMGFTADRLPMVGSLPREVTKRGEEKEGGEWIAAGFNGYGMPLCWSCGEAVARQLLGMEVDFLPDVFAASWQRLRDPLRMNASAGLKMLLGADV